MLRLLRDKADQWWYFLEDPSVPPDNNLAERSLCFAVTKRKVSGGSRSMERFKQTAHLLSVIQTCRFQAHLAMAFFRQAIAAHSCDLLPSRCESIDYSDCTSEHWIANVNFILSNLVIAIDCNQSIVL